MITAHPDMSNIKPGKLQKKKRKSFADAVSYAQTILKDRVKKAAYIKKVKKGQKEHHYAIKEFLKKG
ncbi:MAG: hypothetical protein ACM3H8_07645 [Sphingobacteriales bacterium]